MANKAKQLSTWEKRLKAYAASKSRQAFIGPKLPASEKRAILEVWENGRWVAYNTYQGKMDLESEVVTE